MFLGLAYTPRGCQDHIRIIFGPNTIGVLGFLCYTASTCLARAEKCMTQLLLVFKKQIN